MTKLKYKFTNDALFKMLFVKYPELLKRLVAELLGIRDDSIKEFAITNPEMRPETLGNKYCCLDINMNIDGRRVDLEVQVEDEKDYPERSLYYWAREYSSALPESGEYRDLPRTIVISIIAFKLFACAEFHSEFRLLEATRHEQLTDRMSMHYFELPKLPKKVGKDDELLLWLSLFRSKTEEEILNIQKMEVPIMEQVIEAYRRVSASDELKELARLRDREFRAKASALGNARRQAEAKTSIKIAKNLKANGVDISTIAKSTDLAVDEILKL